MLLQKNAKRQPAGAPPPPGFKAYKKNAQSGDVVAEERQEAAGRCSSPSRLQGLQEERPVWRCCCRRTPRGSRPVLLPLPASRPTRRTPSLAMLLQKNAKRQPAGAPPPPGFKAYKK